MPTAKSYAVRTMEALKTHCERRGIVEVDAVLASVARHYGTTVDGLWASEATLRDLNRNLSGFLELHLAPEDWVAAARAEVVETVAKGLGKPVGKLTEKERAIAERRLVQQVAARGGPVKRRPPVALERPKGKTGRSSAASGP